MAEIKMPEFRNILTLGNLISLLGGVAVGITAWNNVTSVIEDHSRRLDKLESTATQEQKNSQTIKESVIKLEVTQSAMKDQLTDQKVLLRAIDQKLDKLRDDKEK